MSSGISHRASTRRGHRVFGGLVDLDDVPLPGRLFSRLTGGRAGDLRDWPAIERWAGDVGAAVLAATADERATENPVEFQPPRPSAAW